MNGRLQAAWRALDPGPVRDVLEVRARTGLHHTELEQVAGAPEFRGPLPDRGPGVRILGGRHTIAGVLQVVHKSRRIHRQALDARTLAAVLRLRERVPDRITVWETLRGVGIVPSNLRHTFVTLAGEVGRLMTWTSAGVERGRVAQVVGHRAGSTMTADRYERIQVPPLIVLPLRFR